MTLANDLRFATKASRCKDWVPASTMKSRPKVQYVPKVRIQLEKDAAELEKMMGEKAWSVAEISKAMGITIHAASRRVKLLVDDGRAVKSNRGQPYKYWVS